jgi:hypothetical protein
MPQLAGYIKDATGGLDAAFYVSGGMLILAVFVSLFLRRPRSKEEQTNPSEVVAGAL